MSPGDEVRIETPAASEHYIPLLKLTRHGRIEAIDLDGPKGVKFARVSLYYGTKKYAGRLFPMADLKRPRIAVITELAHKKAMQ